MKIVFELDNVLDAAAVSKLLADRHQLADRGADAEITPSTPRKQKAEKVKAKVEDKPELDPAQETQAAPAEQEATKQAPEVSRDELASLVQASVKQAKVGRAKVVEVLASFRDKVDAKFAKEPEIKLPMIPKEHYADVCRQLVAAAKEVGLSVTLKDGKYVVEQA